MEITIRHGVLIWTGESDLPLVETFGEIGCGELLVWHCFDLYLPDEPLIDPTQRHLLKFGVVIGPGPITHSVPVGNVSCLDLP